MSAKGYLCDLPLPEVLQFLQDGKKTGLLSVQSLPTSGEVAKYYFIWLYKGRIVSAVSRLDNRCFASLLHRRRYVTALMITRLIRRCPPDMALGSFLRSKGVLQTEQLKTIFATQVIQQVCGLFKLSNGVFNFDAQAPLPKVEMTGLSLPATEVTLPGLRALKDWSALQHKLPQPQMGLKSLGNGKPHVRINQIEWRIWSLTDGNTSLAQIATQTNLPIIEIQRIAYRLITVGLAEECPLVVASPRVEELQPAFSNVSTSQSASKLSKNFLKNLMGYLRQLPKSS
jgi:Domain of unknown function (DUF4388)